MGTLFASPLARYAALALAAVLLIGGAIFWIYNKGEKAGSSEVTTKVQAETVRTIDRARTEKERVDEIVREKPIDSVIDGLK